MLSKFDDYPIHQIPQPIAQPLSGDRNTYDRYLLIDFGMIFPQSLAIFMLEVTWWTQRALWHLIFSGVLEREPADIGVASALGHPVTKGAVIPERPEASRIRRHVQRIGLFAGPILGILVWITLPETHPDASGEWMELSGSGRATAAVGVWMAIWWLSEAIPVYATALLPRRFLYRAPAAWWMLRDHTRIHRSSSSLAAF